MSGKGQGGQSKSWLEEAKNELQLLRNENERLKEQIPSREDRLKLQIIERLPFSIWACNRDGIIKFWMKGSEKLYRYTSEEALGKNFVTLFVAPDEQHDARVDCVKIIDDDAVFKNFVAGDRDRDGNVMKILTNCFRVYDDENDQWLQAEVAVDIRDLPLRMDAHKNLKDIGKARIASRRSEIIEDLRNMEKRELEHCERSNQEAYERINYLKESPAFSEEIYRDIVIEEQNRIDGRNERRAVFQKECEQLKQRLKDANNVIELEEIEEELGRFSIV